MPERYSGNSLAFIGWLFQGKRVPSTKILESEMILEGQSNNFPNMEIASLISLIDTVGLFSTLTDTVESVESVKQK